MNYQKIYNQIIDRAKTRQIEGYVEKHHIIPRCIGGNDEQDNLVKLTAREHFICHQLLVEIYPTESKLKYALYLMNIGKRKYKKADYKISSRTYERLKIEAGKFISKQLKGRKITDKHKKIISDYHLGSKRSKEWKNNMKGTRGPQPNMKIPKQLSTKKKISESMKGKTWTISESSLKNKRENCFNNIERIKKISISNNHSIIQLDLEDNFIKEWESIKEANLFLGKKYNASSISLNCKGIYKQAFGFKWKYKEDFENKI
jgi:hypothetical protein